MANPIIYPVRPLESCRLRAGLTQREAAKRIGISVRSLRYAEARNREPRPALLKVMAEVYGCDPIELVEQIRYQRERLNRLKSAA